MPARAVLDTQIIVRGIVRRRASLAVDLFDRALGRSGLVAVMSPMLLAEVERILKLDEIRRLANPSLDDDIIAGALKQIADTFDLVAGAFQDIDKVPTDAKDNPIVEAALEGSAEWIVSDDADLLSLKVVKVRGFRPVQVLAPGPFMRILLTPG